MDNDQIIKTLCIVSVLAGSAMHFYCLISLYKIRSSLLRANVRNYLPWLMGLTAVFSVLYLAFALYSISRGDSEALILVSAILLAGAVFVVTVCRVLSGVAREFDKAGQLEKQNISDEAMGIYNRAYFVLRLREEYIRAQRHNLDFSVLLIALDYFDRIHLSYGPEYSNKFIRCFSELIRQSVRQTDITARYGKEEIVILLPNTDLAGARIAAGKIRQAVEEKTFYLNDEHEINPILAAGTVSIGVASYVPALKNSGQLLEQADVALFKARDRGRNQVAVYGE